MDELALLKDFPLEDAATDGAREHARAALEDAMNRRRLPRRYAIALAFVAAALLAAGAYAIVHEFVVGAAAPKDVNAQLEFDVGHFFDYELIPWRGHPRKTAGPTRVAAAAQTPDGNVYLLLTPLKGGGECLFTYTGHEEGPPPSSICSFGKPVHPSGFVYFTQNTTSGLVIVGYSPGAVRVRYGDGVFKTPFGWFVVPSRVDKVLTAYGAHGGVVARVPITHESSPVATPKPAPTSGSHEPTKPPRIIISTHTGWARAAIKNLAFKWIHTNEPLHVAVAPAGQGTRCIYAYVTPPNVGPYCGWPRMRQNELQVLPRPVGWTSASKRTWVTVLVLIGQGGSNIAHADVRFSDGNSAPMTLRRGVIFYKVLRENFSAGHRPAQVIGRDASGRVVARTRLPFVR
jgi:hypothetical protein